MPIIGSSSMTSTISRRSAVTGGGGSTDSARAGALTAGNRTRNMVPRPSALSTSIDPFIDVTMLWQIDSPSPVPSPIGFVV